VPAASQAAGGRPRTGCGAGVHPAQAPAGGKSTAGAVN